MKYTPYEYLQLLLNQRQDLISHVHCNLRGRGRSHTCTNTAIKPNYGEQAPLLYRITCKSVLKNYMYFLTYTNFLKVTMIILG